MKQNIYHIFFRLLKEKHVLKPYIDALCKHNDYAPYSIKNFKQWLRFINDNHINQNIHSLNDITRLISSIEYFCNWTHTYDDKINGIPIQWMKIHDYIFKQIKLKIVNEN